ncbi:unnamed protein product [Agarophyton chilense]
MPEGEQLVTPPSLTTAQGEPTPSDAEGGSAHAAPHTRRQPITHYNSLSVNLRPPRATDVVRGTLQIVEHDLGAKDDLWNIQIYFIWSPRGAETTTAREGSAAMQPINSIKVSVDEFLTVRTQFTLPIPTLTIHLNGARLLGDFYFPNGPDAAMKLFHTLRDFVETLEMKDSFQPGDLYAIEKKNRMRRVVPSLKYADDGDHGEDFADLFDNLSIGDRSRRRRALPRRDRAENAPEDLGMKLLSQFARITQAARELGDGISTLLDEEKRLKEQQRRERESAARRRALDIYADIVASSSEERELPRRLELEEPRGTPITMSVWTESFDEKGKLKDIEVMKRAIFAGGIESNARPDVWPFVLGFYNWDSSFEERSELLEKKCAEYNEMKRQWETLRSSAKADEEKSLLDDPNAVSVDRRERDDSEGTLVMGTILNIYANYDKTITYCQGMSDFLAPILYVIGTKEEAVVFWCFESLMRRIEANFRHDQSGIRRQLAMLKRLIDVADPELSEFFKQTDPEYYTCFRWILVRFKREFAFDSVCRLWEAFWCQSVGGDDIHVFVAAALLIAQRRDLLKLEEGAFDQLLRYINDMSMRIEDSYALREGEICFLKYGEHSHVTS